MARVRISTTAISDWPSFHAEFQSALGFPAFYGANMNAWIDCLSYLRDEGAAGMANVTLGLEETLWIELIDARRWRERVPEIVAALWDCAAFVNRRYVDAGELPAIALVLVEGEHARTAS
jgi:hypothetical protein